MCYIVLTALAFILLSCAADTENITAFQKPNISLSIISDITSDDDTLNATSSRTISIKNSSSTDINDLAVAIKTDYSRQFEISKNSYSTTLPSGSSCNVTLDHLTNDEGLQKVVLIVKYGGVENEMG